LLPDHGICERRNSAEVVPRKEKTMWRFATPVPCGDEDPPFANISRASGGRVKRGAFDKGPGGENYQRTRPFWINGWSAEGHWGILGGKQKINSRESQEGNTLPL